MDDQLKEITIQQQEYEYIRNVSPLGLPGNFFRSRMMNCCVIPPIRAAHKRLQQTERIKIILKTIVILLFCLPVQALFVIMLVLAGSAPAKTNTVYGINESPIVNMREALKTGDVQKAEQILDTAIAKYPDSYNLKAAYAEIDMAKGDFDSAVSTLDDIIMNYFGVQNVASAEHNAYYKTLKGISPDSLTTTREIYQNCISECDKYIAMHESVDKYLEWEDYSSALQLLDELKAAGAYDGYLFYKYAECYNGLGLYDECAKYLLGLYGKSTGITDSVYPQNSAIIYRLDKIKENVSPKLRAQIDSKLEP